MTKMSTVGSASATGSIGGRTTTWASGSTKGQTDADEDEREADQMSMDTNYRDSDRFSASAMDEDLDGDGMSDDTSLVGFGEGAGSTVSGPTYSRSNLVPRTSYLQGSGAGTPLSASTTATAEQQRRDARMIDGLAADEPATGYVDTAARGGCKETSLGGAAFSSYDEGCKGFKCVQERAFLRDTTLLTVFTQTDSLLQRR